MNWRTFIPTLIFAILLMIYLNANKPAKAGVVNIKSVFEQFVLTRELKDELKNIKLKRKIRLDSLAAELNGNKPKSNLQEEYNMLKAQFKVEDDRLTEDYDNRIHQKLAGFLKEFAREKQLNLLYGTEQLGAVLYADSCLDYTNEAIRFVNLKQASK